MRIIKGKEVADKITDDLIKEVENFKSKPVLTIVRVGSNPDDLAYERGAKKRCEKIGICIEVITLNEDVTQREYEILLESLNRDPHVNGILTLRPLPNHIDENKIKDIINPEKDVDGFNPINFSKIAIGDSTGFAPCTPMAVIEIMKHYNIKLTGEHVVIVGRSMVVGKPLSMMMLNENATVTLCHSKTEDLASITSSADILVSAIGRAKMIGHEHVKNGAIVIDVGINVDEKGNLCGDVNVGDHLEYYVDTITPVPGGVGSVTTSILAKHVVEAYKLQNRCETGDRNVYR